MPQTPKLDITAAGSVTKRKRGSETTPDSLVHLFSGKRPHLTLTTANINPAPVDVAVELLEDEDNPVTSPISGLSDPNSLFDEPHALTSYESSTSVSSNGHSSTAAFLTSPPIQGLFFSPSVCLPEDIANSVTRFCLDTYFQASGVNQVMLFGRSAPPSTTPSESSGLPSALIQLLSVLDTMLLPLLPPKTHELLFPRVSSHARQAILNLYKPGEGISPHVDLLGRFGDGIIGVSLGSGCVMQFCRVQGKAGKPSFENASEGTEKDSWDVYLPERSVIVLSEEARYRWTHGIGKYTRDYVALPEATDDETAGRWIERGVRLSITFRWLLPGADIVGDGLNRP